MPEEVFEATTQLVQLALSDNQLSGPIPESTVNLAQLRTMKLGANQLTGMLPVEVLSSLAKNLRELDLSNNPKLVCAPEEVELLRKEFPSYVSISIDPPSAKKKDEKKSRRVQEKEIDPDLVFDDPLECVAEEKAGVELEVEAQAKDSYGAAAEESWDAKAEASSGATDWVEGWDDDSQASYWYSESTGETVWVDPWGTG